MCGERRYAVASGDTDTSPETHPEMCDEAGAYRRVSTHLVGPTPRYVMRRRYTAASSHISVVDSSVVGLSAFGEPSVRVLR